MKVTLALLKNNSLQRLLEGEEEGKRRNTNQRADASFHHLMLFWKRKYDIVCSILHYLVL
jgi:hypothetical protein